MPPVRLALVRRVLLAIAVLALAAPAVASASLVVTLDSQAHDSGEARYYGIGDVATAAIDYPEGPNTVLDWVVNGTHQGSTQQVTTDATGHATVQWTGSSEGNDTVSVTDNATSTEVGANARFVQGDVVSAGGANITAIFLSPD